MDRLRLLLVLTAAVVCRQPVSAQLPSSGEQTSLAPSATASFAVIGDVANCNSFPIPVGRELSLRDAVTAAGAANGSLSVSVLRAGQTRVQWTQMLLPDSADGSEVVRPGDILIVQEIGRTSVTATGNAALQTTGGVIVVALSDSAIAVGDVLLQTGAMPEATATVSIVHRLNGRPPVAQAKLSEPVTHGDVISVGNAVADQPSRFGRMQPAFSEWQSSPGTASGAAIVPEAPVSDSSPTPANDQFGSGALSVPDVPMSIPPATLAEPAEPVVPQTVSQSARVADPFAELATTPAMPEALLIPIAQSQTVADEFPATTPMETAPLPPLEQPISMEAPANEISAWNILFISGLLIAGSLILAGSLRVDDDEPQSAQSGMASAGTQVSVPAASIRLSDETDFHSASLEPFVRPTEIDKSITTSIRHVAIREHVPIGNLVVATEWFSGDWVNQPTPAVAAETGRTQVTTSPVTPLEIVRPVAVIEPARPVAAVIKPAAAVEQPATGVVPAELDTDLEDLLQNRLPVDLQQTRLPMRVALFGRPAGPRYLRIDAAHTQLAGPHTNMASERRRESAGVGATAGRSSQSMESDLLDDSPSSLH